MNVDEEVVHREFKAPNEVYKRALRRLRDGHIDTQSFSVMQAIKSNTTDRIYVFTSQVAASLRTVNHTTRVVCTPAGDVLPAPFSYCSCEVGALGCAHLISLHLAAMHVKNCARVWKLVKPNERVLNAEEILGLFPPTVTMMQRTPCRATYLARRSRKKTVRGLATRDVLLAALKGRAETDESDEGDEDDSRDAGRDVCIPLTKIVGDWTFEMFKLDPASLAAGNAQVERPRAVSAALRTLMATYQSGMFPA